MGSVPRTSLGKWRSIEFECVLKNGAALCELKAFINEKGYRKRVTIKGDGSIEPNRSNVRYDAYGYQIRNENYEIGREIVVSYRSGKEQIVHDICDFLKSRAYVNSTCGTHVHFDMRHVDADMARLYGARLACAVPALRTILPPSRRNNSFCRETINGFREDGYGNRYAFVNLLAYHKHKTIEVRGHSGTLNATKILNWIALCEKVMFSANTKSVKSVKDLVKHYKLEKPLATFVEKRHKEVNARNAVAET
jgi:hypothetical protein